jgi:hypothetical protein
MSSCKALTADMIGKKLGLKGGGCGICSLGGSRKKRRRRRTKRKRRKSKKRRKSRKRRRTRRRRR